MSFLGMGRDEPLMNPLYVAWVGSIIRTGLPYVAGGATLYSDSDIEKLAGALVTIGMLAWSMYQKAKSKQVQNTLAAKAGTTVEIAKAEVASPHIATPSASAPENVVPSPPSPVMGKA